MPKNYNQLSDIWWCFLFPFYLHSALLKKKIIKKTMTWFQIPRYWKARMQVLVQLCSQDELKVKAYCQSRTTGYFLIMFLKIKFCKPWGNLCPTRCIWSLLLSFFFFFVTTPFIARDNTPQFNSHCGSSTSMCCVSSFKSTRDGFPFCSTSILRAGDKGKVICLSTAVSRG